MKKRARAFVKSVLDPLQVKDNGPDAIGATGDDRVLILHPAGEATALPENQIALVNVVPGPSTKVLRLPAVRLHDELLPIGEMKFLLTDYDMEVQFVQDFHGKIVRMMIDQVGEIITLIRID